jgi:hypothetical protein
VLVMLALEPQWSEKKRAFAQPRRPDLAAVLYAQMKKEKWARKRTAQKKKLLVPFVAMTAWLCIRTDF